MYNASTTLELPEIAQERINSFLRKSQVLDASMEQFLRNAGFKLETPGSCPPFRAVRSTGERMEMLDFAVHQEWKSGGLEPELQYSLEAICHHFNSRNPNVVLTKKERVAQGFTLHELSANLPALLAQAMQLFEDWTPEVVVSTGQRRGQFWSLVS